jgi:hypothetical protein
MMTRYIGAFHSDLNNTDYCKLCTSMDAALKLSSRLFQTVYQLLFYNIIINCIYHSSSLFRGVYVLSHLCFAPPGDANLISVRMD